MSNTGASFETTTHARAREGKADKLVRNAEVRKKVRTETVSAPEEHPLQRIKQLAIEATACIVGTIPIRVVASPKSIGITVPTNVVASGVTVANGDIYVFQSGVGSALYLYRVVFHKLILRGSSASSPNRIVMVTAKVDPESQKKAVADGIEQQKAKLAELGYGDALKEFFGDKAAPAAYSHGYGPGISQGELAQVVDDFLSQFGHQAPVKIADSAIGVLPGATHDNAISGAVHGGRIHLFLDQIPNRVEARVTVFHELFHFGIQKVILAEQYAALMRTYASNPKDQWILKTPPKESRATVRGELAGVRH